MNRIKALRKAKNLTQTELSSKAMISQPFLYDLENNRRNAKPETFQRIANALEVPVSELMVKEGG